VILPPPADIVEFCRKVTPLILFQVVFRSVKVKISHKRPRWLKGFRVG
jgi:hypothetical protein